MKINLKDIINENPKKDENWITPVLEEKKVVETEKKQTSESKCKLAVKEDIKAKHKPMAKAEVQEEIKADTKSTKKAKFVPVDKTAANSEDKHIIKTTTKEEPKAAVKAAIKAELMASANVADQAESKTTPTVSATESKKVAPQVLKAEPQKVNLNAGASSATKAEPKKTASVDQNATAKSRFKSVFDFPGASGNYRDMTVELMPKTSIKTVVESGELENEVIIGPLPEIIAKPVPDAKAEAITEQLPIIDAMPEAEALDEAMHVINEESKFTEGFVTEDVPATDRKLESDIGNEPEDKLESKAEPKRKTLYKRYGWVMVIATSFTILLVAMFVYTNMIPKEVYATINGKTHVYSSTENTLEGFLEEENISYCSDDYISKPVTAFIHDGMKFELKNAVDFEVTADGKTKTYKTLEHTVKDALDDEDIKVGKLDIVEPGLDATLSNDMDIVIKRVDVKAESEEVNIPYKTVTKNDASMSAGSSKVITEGKNGKAMVTYEVTYVDGVETSKKEVSRETLVKTTDKVVATGTQISYNGETYSRKLTVKAYSYTGGGRTASGTRARVGEIAVDPSVIPLGSTVYIEGVGARMAEDTGGNIKGNTIDIYMDSEAECRRWGVRTVTLYIK